MSENVSSGNGHGLQEKSRSLEKLTETGNKFAVEFWLFISCVAFGTPFNFCRESLLHIAEKKDLGSSNATVYTSLLFQVTCERYYSDFSLEVLVKFVNTH